MKFNLIETLGKIAYDMGYIGAVITIEDGVVIMSVPQTSQFYTLSPRRFWLGLARSGKKHLVEQMNKIS